MASALDKQLGTYKTRPQDESGAVKSKASLIFDPKEASFIDKDTFYQIGFQGFTNLCRIEPRLEKFSKSIFAYSNVQSTDPWFLNAQENKEVGTELEQVLFYLSNYVMEPATVQILEYLIQQYAATRMRPAHLILIALPYLETSLFVRIMQTIPFRSLPHEYKYVKMFSSVAQSKKPITRTVLRDWIVSRPVLLKWIIEGARQIADIYPDGVFVKFIGVLFAELCSQASDEMIKTIISKARSSFDSNSALAPHLMMSVALVNEKEELKEELLNEFANLLFNSERVDALFMPAVYFAAKANVQPPPEYITNLVCNMSTVDRVTKKFKVKPLAEKCIDTIVDNLDNEDVVRAATALLETDMFNDVAIKFAVDVAAKFVENAYTKQLIQGIVWRYPEALTITVVNKLQEIGVEVAPNQLSSRNLVSQLSNPSQAAALYSNPALPFDIASAQVVSSLRAAKASDSADCLEPIFQYFQERAPADMIEFLIENVFMDGTDFSRVLNAMLTKYGEQYAPFFTGIPNTNKEILSYLSQAELPDEPLFPFVLAKAAAGEDPSRVLDFLPIRNINFDTVAAIEREIAETGEFILSSTDAKAALILAVVDVKTRENSDISVEAIGKLFDFPDLKSIVPIIKNINSNEKVMAAFERSKPEQKRLRTNVLYYINAIATKIENPILIIPALFMAITFDSPELIDHSVMVMKTILGPLSRNKDMKVVLTQVLRHNFKVDPNTVRGIFHSIAQNAKSRDFFNSLWDHIQTASGCGRFWALTHDVGVIDTIKKFVDDPQTPEFFGDVLKAFPVSKFPQVTELYKWALKSLNSRLIREVIPYLTMDDLNKVLYPVCAYPRFYSDAFTEYFMKQKIDAKVLAKTLKEAKETAVKGDVSVEPPVVFPVTLSKLKPKAVIPPAVLILELLPRSYQAGNIANMPDLLPTFFNLMKYRRCQNLVFGCLAVCMETSSKYIVEHFNVIVESISQTGVPHVHSTALQLMTLLARKYPEEVSKHATALFTSLSGQTIFSDDSANLTKIKQILTTVLPILSKTNNVEPLLIYFAQNLDNFSIDRASQLMVHSIKSLGDDSYKVFAALLSENRMEFSLLIVDQLGAEDLMTALIHLAQTPIEVGEFISQIQLPPIPQALIQLFTILDGRMDIDAFFVQTCDSFGLDDFLAFMKELVPSPIAIYDIIKARIQAEPTSQFVELLPALEKKLGTFEALDTTIAIVTEISNVLTKADVPALTGIISAVMNGINNDNYTIPIKIQALSMMATVMERFDITDVKLFSHVVDFASELYNLIVSEDIAAAIVSTTASIRLLIKTSVLCCIKKLPVMWANMLSPSVIGNPELYELVKESLLQAADATNINALKDSFGFTYSAHKQNPESLILLFQAFEQALKRDERYTCDLHGQIGDFFSVAFAQTRADDWETNLSVQDSIISAFVAFMSQLKEKQLITDLSTFNNNFLMITKRDQPDYVANRIFYIRTLNTLIGGMGQPLVPNYGQWLPHILNFIEQSNDADFIERQLTCFCMDLIQTMASISDTFFEAERFQETLEAIVKHASTVSEASVEDYLHKIIGHVAPAFSSVVASARDDNSRRLADQEMIELMRNKDVNVRMAGITFVDEAFRNIETALAPILPEIIPTLNELLEDPAALVQNLARNLMDKLPGYIHEPNLDAYLR